MKVRQYISTKKDSSVNKRGGRGRKRKKKHKATDLPCSAKRAADLVRLATVEEVDGEDLVNSPDARGGGEEIGLTFARRLAAAV